MPDLLFEDVLEERVADLGRLVDEPSVVGTATGLHRVTLFVTYKCNLACPYCKTIARSNAELLARPQKSVTYSFEAFVRVLDSHGNTPIEHLHFTGGEASLVDSLPEMITYAKSRGVGCVSITSNGARPPETYVRLVEAGIDEIRISVDAADEETGQAFTARKGAWSASIETLRVLGKLRREGAEFFLIVNTVVTQANRERLDRIVTFLLSLGPDDLKLITEVDSRDSLADFPSARKIVAHLHELLSQKPVEMYPLLRRKIDTVFQPDAIGLDQVKSGSNKDWRCFIPLTERTVDGVYYYPCSVYLRESGEPIGRIDESQEEQRRKTAAFVTRGDCLSDPICKKYCLHCTREFNIRANEARS